MLASIDKNGNFVSIFKKQIVEIDDKTTALFQKIEKFSNKETPDLEGWSKFADKLDGADDSLKDFLKTKDEAYQTKDITTYNKYLQDQNKLIDIQTVKTKALNVVKNIGINLGIAAVSALITNGIGLLINQIDDLIHKTENAIKAGEEAQEKIKSIKDEMDSMSNTVQESAKRFAELSEGVDRISGKNLSLSTEDYEEFLKISNNLATLFPTLSRNYTENGDAIIQLSGGVDTIVGSLENLLKVEQDLKKQEIFENMDKVYEGAVASYKKSKSQYNENLIKRDNIQKIIDNIDINDLINETGTYEWYETDELSKSLAYVYKQALTEIGASYSALGETDKNGDIYSYISRDYLQMI
ncbi:MAG: hypothetical protein ACI4SA_07110 [Lachnospiraceae bacterium]